MLMPQEEAGRGATETSVRSSGIRTEVSIPTNRHYGHIPDHECELASYIKSKTPSYFTRSHRLVLGGLHERAALLPASRHEKYSRTYARPAYAVGAAADWYQGQNPYELGVSAYLALLVITH